MGFLCLPKGSTRGNLSGLKQIASPYNDHTSKDYLWGNMRNFIDIVKCWRFFRLKPVKTFFTTLPFL
jgi:hypothetical protein